MTNICWDLAPEGAVAVGQRFGGLAFINYAGLAYIGDDWVDSSGWNIVGKRPQPQVASNPPETFGYDLKAEEERRKAMFEGAIEEAAKSIHNPHPEQPRKTVEDAVAEHKGEWPLCHGISLMGYSPKHDQFFTFSDGYHCCDGEYQVCTHEEFEACVAAKSEPEWKELSVYGKPKSTGDKPEWTHTLHGSECVLLDPDKDCDGYYIAKTHYGAYELAKEHELKPIKPTITKAEAEKRLGATITD